MVHFIKYCWVLTYRKIYSGHVTHMGETKNAYNILAEEHDGKRPLGELQHKWE